MLGRRWRQLEIIILNKIYQSRKEKIAYSHFFVFYLSLSISCHMQYINILKINYKLIYYVNFTYDMLLEVICSWVKVGNI